MNSPIGGNWTARGKQAYLRSLDVLSVPAPYDEPKGIFLLEAMAAGVPGGAGRAGAHSLKSSRRPGVACWSRRTIPTLSPMPCSVSGRIARRQKLWGSPAFRAYARHYSVAHSASRLLEVYEEVLRPYEVAGSFKA